MKPYNLGALLALASAFLALSQTAHADIFLEIPGIEGESQVVDHENDIVINSFDWGLTQSTPHYSAAAGPRTKQRSLPDAIVLHKTVDKSTPKLYEACAQGTHFGEDEVVIQFTKTQGETQAVYLEYRMSDCIISSVDTGTKAGDPVPTESLSFNFAKLEVRYYRQNDAGGFDPPVVFRWDFDLDQPF